MSTFQIENLEAFLEWLKTCPHQSAISSMQGGFVHVKFFIDTERPTTNKSNDEEDSDE